MLDQGQVLRCAFTHTDLANSRFFALSNAGNTNPSSMAWLTVTFRQIYTGHLICFTSCTESFTSQCIPRQANFISITFGVENRLHLCSICARWMRHKWGIVWNPPKKVAFWYSVSKASLPQDTLKPFKSLHHSLFPSMEDKHQGA